MKRSESSKLLLVLGLGAAVRLRGRQRLTCSPERRSGSAQAPTRTKADGRIGDGRGLLRRREQGASCWRWPTPRSRRPRQKNGKKPNILFIMGDDIGWMQPGCYHRGLMVGETPNIDRIASEGGDLHGLLAMQSCTSGRNAFVTGHVPAAHRHDPPAACPAARPTCDRAPRASPSSCSISATPPASSARTTSATTPTRCRRPTAFRSTGATSTTWTPCSR